MAKQSLAAMSVDALLKLRDDIGAVLSQKATDLKRQLSRLGDKTFGGNVVGNGGRATKGRKVAPKYRDPKSGATWAARGATPRWMVEAIKGGAKKEDFLIVKASKKSAKKARKK
jgi:DNA-binding protein H-NS